MKNKSLIFGFAIVLFLSNCAPLPAASATIQPTFSAVPPSLPSLITPTQQPLSSAKATMTFIPTQSPTQRSPILGKLSSPPYLVYVKKMSGKEQVVLVNQDGTGLKIMPLPDNGFNGGNPSPTGEWLVFYTGSGGEQALENGPQYDLTLNLMHLPDGALHKVTSLLSKSFPDNLETFAEMAKSNDPDISTMNTTDIVNETRRNLIYRLMIAQWSPSGESLAFAGAMDGPSTDLYLYNLKTHNIQRLSSGSKNIDFIDWFPNGSQILYSSSYLPCEGDCSTYYVTDLDGSHSREIKNFDTFGGATSINNWSAASILTLYTRANVTGTCCLRNFDFENDKLNMLYGGSFENYAFDPQTNLLAISITDDPQNVPPGTYFVDKNDMRKVEEVGLVYYLGWKNYPFIVAANGTKLLSASGESKTLSDQEFVPFASRNNQYVALCDLEWGNTTYGLRVFNNNENLVFEIKDQKITNVVWRIDSQGLFYVVNNQLFYVGVQDKTSLLIDARFSDNEFDTEAPLSFTWVR